MPFIRPSTDVSYVPINLCEALRGNSQLFDILVAKQEYEDIIDKNSFSQYDLSNNRDVSIPIVSNYLINKGFLNVEWPEESKFAVCLTHDVDQVYPTWKYTAFTATKLALKLNPKEGLRRLVGKAKKQSLGNPCWNFKKIVCIYPILQ